jgi:hypothetical protein
MGLCFGRENIKSEVKLDKKLTKIETLQNSV